MDQVIVVLVGGERIGLVVGTTLAGVV